MIEKISNRDLIEYTKKVEEDIKYGGEAIIIDEALKQFPSNTNKSLVAMKISLIDLTNGTNLSRNLGKSGGLYKLSEKITKVDFDNRVRNGDLSLVEELARWTKKELRKNLFSFISKYCLYHNVHCYNRDDFVIYDSVVSDNIKRYIAADEYRELTGKRLYKNSFVKLKDTFNYKEYVKVIDYIIQKNNITIDRPHRKLDWFIWYKNRM